MRRRLAHAVFDPIFPFKMRRLIAESGHVIICESNLYEVGDICSCQGNHALCVCIVCVCVCVCMCITCMYICVCCRQQMRAGRCVWSRTQWPRSSRSVIDGAEVYKLIMVKRCCKWYWYLSGQTGVRNGCFNCECGTRVCVCVCVWVRLECVWVRLEG